MAVMLNINYGRNKELMDKCKRLHDYAYFVNEVNRNTDKGYPCKRAMEHCEKNDILSDILSKQRGEVLNLLLNEFDVKSYENWIRSESREEGILMGRAENIIELLEDVGEVPDSLKDLIMEQKNRDVQRNWLKSAAKARSIEDFERAIGVVSSEK